MKTQSNTHAHTVKVEGIILAEAGHITGYDGTNIQKAVSRIITNSKALAETVSSTNTESKFVKIQVKAEAEALRLYDNAVALKATLKRRAGKTLSRRELLELKLLYCNYSDNNNFLRAFIDISTARPPRLDRLHRTLIEDLRSLYMLHLDIAS